jgi:hypothetical protein
MLVGTWAAADWAIRFYERHGFALTSPAQKTVLLQTYWSIPDRQIETSVVLANPPDRRGVNARPNNIAAARPPALGMLASFICDLRYPKAVLTGIEGHLSK